MQDQNRGNRYQPKDEGDYIPYSRRPTGSFQPSIDESYLNYSDEEQNEYGNNGYGQDDNYGYGDRYSDRRRYNARDEYIPPKKNKKRQSGTTGRGCLTISIYAIIIISISSLLSFYILIGVNDMFALKKEDVTAEFDIPSDASTEEIAKILKENGVIDYPFFFKLFAGIKMDEDDHFKHGTFRISTKSDYNQIVRLLTRPATSDGSIVKVTFPEGCNILQYAQILEDNNVCTKEAFLESVNTAEFDYEFLKDIKFGEGSDRIYRLEGYLFPDTYEFYINEGSKSAITKMLNNFNRKYEDTIKEAMTNSSMSLDQILTIAAIIERETPSVDEKGKVSSVFHNRIKSKDYPKLQSDATRAYPYPTFEDVPADMKETFESKYDTNKINGLPPGPICNPSISSITAAANPESTSYYFFYTDKNSVHYYASTYAGHQKNISDCEAKGVAA